MDIEGRNSVEEWRPMPFGYSTHYSVSNFGRVRREKAGPGTHVGFMLAPRYDKDGYNVVVLWKSNIPKDCKVHQAVLRAFKGPRPKGHVTNHLNGDKADNRLENLEYATPSQNLIHAHTLLTRKRRTPVSHCRRGHLLTEQNSIWENSNGYRSRRCRFCRKLYRKAR